MKRIPAISQAEKEHRPDHDIFKNRWIWIFFSFEIFFIFSLGNCRESLNERHMSEQNTLPVRILAPHSYEKDLRAFSRWLTIHSDSKIEFRFFFDELSNSDQNQVIVDQIMRASQSPTTAFDLVIYPLNQIQYFQSANIIQSVHPHRLVFFSRIPPLLRSTILDPSGIYSIPFALRRYGMWINKRFVAETSTPINFRSIALYFSRSPSVSWKKSYFSPTLLHIFAKIYMGKRLNLCDNSLRTRRLLIRFLRQKNTVESSGVILGDNIGVHLGEKKYKPESNNFADDFSGQVRQKFSASPYWRFVYPNESAVWEVYSFFLLRSVRDEEATKRVLDQFLKASVEKDFHHLLAPDDGGFQYSKKIPITFVPECFYEINQKKTNE